MLAKLLSHRDDTCRARFLTRRSEPSDRSTVRLPAQRLRDGEHGLRCVIHCRTTQLASLGQIEATPAVNGGPVVPHDEIADLPLVHIDAVTLRSMLEQIGKQQARFRRAQAYDLTSVHPDKEDL